jgi:hypothetical protein
MSTVVKRLCFALVCVLAAQASAQLAPTGAHYAGRASDTGYGGTFVGATRIFAASVPLQLPSSRGGLPIPLQIVHGGRGVGAAGLGWDVPLSYITRDRSFAYRRPASSPGVLPVPRERVFLSLAGESLGLMRRGKDWIARSGTLELVARETTEAWLAYDGHGRTYTFVRPAS